MKILAVILTIVFLASCAPKKDPVWNMTWSCGTNATCANHMGEWRGSGSFSNESDCLVWETAFINSYFNSFVTSCTESN